MHCHKSMALCIINERNCIVPPKISSLLPSFVLKVMAVCSAATFTRTVTEPLCVNFRALPTAKPNQVTKEIIDTTLLPQMALDYKLWHEIQLTSPELV